MPLTSETFSCGHEKTPGNTGVTSRGKATYTLCITCRRQRDRERNARPERKDHTATRKRVARAKAEGREVPMSKKNKAVATDHLKLPIRAIKAESELHLAMEEDRAKCEDRSAEWIDYDPDTNAPNRSVARAMCAGCPLIEQCSAFAAESRPAIGVWGGEVWLDGAKI